MKKHITTIVTLAVLLVLAFMYINNDLLEVKGTANAGGANLLETNCSMSGGLMTGADWRKCQAFVQKVLKESDNSTDAEIIRLRQQINSILQQINNLNTQ